MLDELKEEAIVNKVGGRFKLSTLIQKRLVQLNQGSRPLVNMKTADRMKVVLQEIAPGQDLPGQPRTRCGSPARCRTSATNRN